MSHRYLKQYLIFLIIWTLLLALLLVWDVYNIKKDTHVLAVTKAQANFNKDQAIRHWVSMHGGVYVAVDSNTQPNPALSHVVERDIQTPSGKALTLMNPAYMVRELNEYFADFYGVKGHITSTNLLRAENKPDEWELAALNRFESGELEVMAYSPINNEMHLRYMQPMITKESCLKCHAHQGYKVGDIRGGVGIAIPVEPLLQRERADVRRETLIFLIIWIFGGAMSFYAYRSLNRNIYKREQAENALAERNELLNLKSKELEQQNNEYYSLNEELIASEEEVRTSNEELLVKSKQLEAINIELIKARDKAMESDKLKSEFINNMSHEIRTPMNGIIGFANILKKARVAKEKQRFYIDIIQSSAHQLMRVIDDIIEISRLGTKQVKVIKSKFDLRQLLKEQYSIFSMEAKENKTPLVLTLPKDSEDLTLNTDESKLIKALSNLIENAIKYTSKGSIEIGCRINENIEIFVKDPGIGIDKAFHESVFNKFSQGGISNRKTLGGLGLGLAIAKENCTLLGGTIRLESEVNVGSVFTIELPKSLLDKSNQITVKESKSTSLKKASMIKVLIVEDDRVNSYYLQELLSVELRLNCKIAFAETGLEAIEKYAETTPDIVFMDIKLPEMNGVEATEQLRRLNDKVPIVMQTAYASEQDKKKAYEAGCNAYLVKPISKSQVENVIDQFLI